MYICVYLSTRSPCIHIDLPVCNRGVTLKTMFREVPSDAEWETRHQQGNAGGCRLCGVRDSCDPWRKRIHFQSSSGRKRQQHLGRAHRGGILRKRVAVRCVGVMHATCMNLALLPRSGPVLYGGHNTKVLQASVKLSGAPVYPKLVPTVPYCRIHGCLPLTLYH